jgi:hypothetical protein
MPALSVRTPSDWEVPIRSEVAPPPFEVTIVVPGVYRVTSWTWAEWDRLPPWRRPGRAIRVEGYGYAVYELIRPVCGSVGLP